MKFNTAILYDIENLIGGYGKTEFIQTLSLKEIFRNIQELNNGLPCIQRAYANWSDPRLKHLRDDINELGIEPIQMFGFGKGTQKNASDIQLAIDAVEMALTREHIDTFVIVSGDGGFSSLAKKLHEYGKKVIGCAYQRATNKIFEAVSDQFLWLNEPYVKPEIHVEGVNTNDPIVMAFIRQFDPLRLQQKDQVVGIAKECLVFLSQNPDAEVLLHGSGLNISIFSQIMEYRLGTFNYFNLGFVRLIDFLRFITYESSCKVVFKAPSEYRVVFKKHTIPGYIDEPHITSLSPVHTIPFYKKMLSKGTPMFKAFDGRVFDDIVAQIDHYRLAYEGHLLCELIEKLGSLLPYEEKEIKNCLLSLVAAGCFDRYPDDKRISEQHLTFSPEGVEEAREKLQEGMRSKLEELIGDVDEEIFMDVLVPEESMEHSSVDVVE
ncbi:NYN domain-containing protein [Halosquirtibacter xylanolyticus]|uniref:NYN domain-containing protein n=1 Tax=Halosquirtibacter xylanolyticus TaxID=3374599 RepID=UPI00374985B9|nr:NYN domain-containing protein [Prolixibacteraceae bacterium]